MMRSFLTRTIFLSGLVAVGLTWSCTPEEIGALTSPPATNDKTEKPDEDNKNNRPSGIPVFEETKAFPTAEGYGRFSKGGRGGRTIYVTSLEDNKEKGTLRYALEVASGPRNVLFKVSGLIELSKNINITEPYVTIAGQTSPGGITLKDAGLQIETHDVVIRHLKIRPGDYPGGMNPGDRDCIIVYKNRNCNNVVLDHLSLTWGIDENLSFCTGTNKSTVQNCIIAEGLSHSLHNEGEHSKGFLMLNDIDDISIINNLFAHNMNRNPLISSNSRNIHVVNNLIYNWGHMKPGYGTHTQIYKDEVPINDAVIYRNVYRKGKTSHDLPLYRTGNWYLVDGSTLFVDENYLDNGSKLSSLKDVSTSYNKFPEKFSSFEMSKAPSKWQSGYSEIVSADQVVERVLSTAGARVPLLDPVDTRITNEARNFTGDFVDSPSQRGGYPKAEQAKAPADSDNDGIPDKWEEEQGLNPNSADDGSKNTISPYYTNLEMYLNHLAGDFTI